jgi:hypothetical protein
VRSLAVATTGGGAWAKSGAMGSGSGSLTVIGASGDDRTLIDADLRTLVNSGLNVC